MDLYDSVDPEELTVGVNDAENVINVYYVLDENGPDGEPDQIPDSEEYSVSYQGNGGLNEMGEATYTDPNIYPAGYQEVYASPGDMFTKENAVFAYWKDEKTGNEVDANAVFTMPVEDVSLIAQWEMLSISKNYTSKDGNFKLGDQIDFTIKVESSGDADLTNEVVVTDLLPNVVIKPGKGYNVVNNTAVIPAGMKAGSEVTVEAYYVVTVDEIGKEIVNTAKATTEGIEVEDSTDTIPKKH